MQSIQVNDSIYTLGVQFQKDVIIILLYIIIYKHICRRISHINSSSQAITLCVIYQYYKLDILPNYINDSSTDLYVIFLRIANESIIFLCVMFHADMYFRQCNLIIYWSIYFQYNVSSRISIF